MNKALALTTLASLLLSSTQAASSVQYTDSLRHDSRHRQTNEHQLSSLALDVRKVTSSRGSSRYDDRLRLEARKRAGNFFSVRAEGSDQSNATADINRVPVPILSDYWAIFANFTFNGYETSLLVDTGSMDVWDVKSPDDDKKFTTLGESCCSDSKCCGNGDVCDWDALHQIGASSANERKQCKGVLQYISSGTEVTIGRTDLGVANVTVIKNAQVASGQDQVDTTDAFSDEQVGIAGFGIMPESDYTHPVLSTFFQDFTFVFKTHTYLKDKLEGSQPDGLFNDGYQLLLGSLESYNTSVSQVASWVKLPLLPTNHFEDFTLGWALPTPFFKIGDKTYTPPLETVGEFDTGTGWIDLPYDIYTEVLKQITAGGKGCKLSPCSFDPNLIYQQCETLEGLQSFSMVFGTNKSYVEVKLAPEDFALQGLCDKNPQAYVINIYGHQRDKSLEPDGFYWWLVGLDVIRRFAAVRHSVAERYMEFGALANDSFVVASESDGQAIITPTSGGDKGNKPSASNLVMTSSHLAATTTAVLVALFMSMML